MRYRDRDRRDHRDQNIEQAKDYPKPLQDAMLLSEIPRPNSKWDKPPAGLENASVEHVRLLGVFEPGKPLDGDSLAKLKQKISLPPLTAEFSLLNRSIIAQQEDTVRIAKFFDEIHMSSKQKTRLLSGCVLVELDSPKHVAILLAQDQFKELTRPPGLITGKSESIWSDEDTQIVTSEHEGDEVVRVDDKVVGIYSRSREGRPLYPVKSYFEPTSCLVIVNAGHSLQDAKEFAAEFLVAASDVHIEATELPQIYARFDATGESTSVGTSLDGLKWRDRTILCGYYSPAAYQIKLF